jgi:hypothetical protein
VNCEPPTPGPAPEPGPNPTAAATPPATPKPESPAADSTAHSAATTSGSRGADATLRRRVKRSTLWLIGVVVAAVVGLLVTGGYEWFQRELSETRPLRPVIIPPSPSADTKEPAKTSTEYGDAGFQLLVTDPGRLPANIAEIDDCATLWDIGRSAGGSPVEDPPSSDLRIDVQGESKEGLRIVGLRAKVTKRAPTADGVLLVCLPEPPLGGEPQEPIRISFDFRAVDLERTDSVPAVREGSPKEGEDARQFEEGYSIALDKNESIQLAVSTAPSTDDVDWYLEADAVVGGTVKTIRIDAGGKAFHTPGYRRFDDYQEGHSGKQPGWHNGPALDWGVDKDTVLARNQDGSQVLRWNGVSIPYTKGLEVYRPYENGDGFINRYREIRYNGRRLISFNPPGVDARKIRMGDGEPCRVGTHRGTTESVGPVVSEIRRHGNGNFRHRTIDYVCSGPSRLREGYRLESAQKLGSPIVFVSGLDETATAEGRKLARFLLRNIEDSSS